MKGGSGGGGRGGSGGKSGSALGSASESPESDKTITSFGRLSSSGISRLVSMSMRTGLPSLDGRMRGTRPLPRPRRLAGVGSLGLGLLFDLVTSVVVAGALESVDSGDFFAIFSGVLRRGEGERGSDLGSDGRSEEVDFSLRRCFGLDESSGGVEERRTGEVDSSSFIRLLLWWPLTATSTDLRFFFLTAVLWLAPPAEPPAPPEPK